MSSGGTVMIIAGGEAVQRQALGGVPAGDYVIAADSGLDLALRLGIPVDAVIGDLDSASEHAIETAREAGVTFSVHPEDKDKTDLELALDLAYRRSPERVFIVGGGGGRVDHLLGNAALIAHADLPEVTWITDTATVYVVRDRAEIGGSAGRIVSLLPIGADATGVRTHGLAWELGGETLKAGSSRGLSNRFTGSVVRIEVDTGALLVIVGRPT